MNHVPRSWLRRFQLALVGLDVIIIGIYLYARFTGTAATTTMVMASHDHAGMGHTMTPPFGVTIIIAALALFHLVYTASVVWWFDKRQTWLIHATGVLTTGVMLVLLTNSESPWHTFHHFILIAFTFCAAMVGTLVAGLTVALAFGFLLVTSLGTTHLTSDPSGHVVEMLLVNLSAVGAVAGWYIFNKRYVQEVDSRLLADLTSRVKQERTTVNLILESITDGVMLINPDGVVQAVNTSCAKILGWSKQDAQNLQYESLLQVAVPPQEGKTPPSTPETQEKLIIPLAASTGEPQHQVSLIKTHDDRQIYVDITASPIFGEEEVVGGAIRKVVGVIVVLRDVDKQKREEQQRSEFISTASHEMRTPVAAIEGYLALALNSKVSTIDDKARGYIEKAHSSTQHLGKLFQDLLTSAKAEDGRLVSHPQVIEMGQYLEQLVDTLRFTAEKKGLLLDFTIGAGSPTDPNAVNNGKVIKPLYYVHADPDRMREVITNLFDNAVKYTETGKISIGLTGNNEVVQFFIKDTGPGIPATDVGHLFQKFYRVDNSATRTIGGTGLGLFICRKIVELYKGRIWVESEFGKGSTFYINLPRLSSQKADELLKTESANAAAASPLDKS